MKKFKTMQEFLDYVNKQKPENGWHKVDGNLVGWIRDSYKCSNINVRD